MNNPNVSMVNRVINVNPNIEEGWKNALTEEFRAPYFLELKSFLLNEKRDKEIYPPSSLIFNAFNACPFDKVRVVVLGQDPYHGPGQAHGLSFSVPTGVKHPPSLRNILRELHNDLGCDIPDSGDLSAWAAEGVLLLNAILTVRKSEAGAHQNRGWERFTDAVIGKISQNKSHVVFLLWGNYARAKKSLIDTERHLVLEAAHPSPFSAHNGFFGCKHFSQTNDYLAQHGIQTVHWDLA